MNNFLKRALFIAMIGTIILYINGCCLRPKVVQQGPDYSFEISQLRQIVIRFGIPESKASQMNLNELVTEIKIKMNDSSTYSGKLLSNEDKENIKLTMFGENRLLEILNDYHNFIKGIEGKQIIVLPEE